MRILVVEDEPHVADVIRESLTAGCHVLAEKPAC